MVGKIDMAKILLDKEIVEEAVDTLYTARFYLLKKTALDSPQEMAEKEIKNDCAITRKILSIINLIKEDIKMVEEEL